MEDLAKYYLKEIEEQLAKKVEVEESLEKDVVIYGEIELSTAEKYIWAYANLKNALDMLSIQFKFLKNEIDKKNQLIKKYEEEIKKGE